MRQIPLETDPPGSKTLANEPLIAVARRRGNASREEGVTAHPILPVTSPEWFRQAGRLMD
jgi:hypothetical protein